MRAHSPPSLPTGLWAGANAHSQQVTFSLTADISHAPHPRFKTLSALIPSSMGMRQSTPSSGLGWASATSTTGLPSEIHAPSAASHVLQATSCGPVACWRVQNCVQQTRNENITQHDSSQHPHAVGGVMRALREHS
jgi:hypothetical protein